MTAHNRRNTPPRRQIPMNDRIFHKTLILIDVNGEKIGEVATADALAKAQAQELDLVVINEKSNPVIAKIMDYGKHLYEQKRKLRDSKKKATFVKVKSINVKPQINDHDLSWKADQAISWLQDGDRVQFVIKVYGRIGTKTELIQQTYQKFAKLLENYGSPQADLKRVSPVMYEVFFTPLKSNSPKGEKNNG
ncbi:translation initiation factor IF-3 [Mycoplasmoides fastidiosum]|uniref:translation initiation factor IF-3 n=1 Tax=Mycoplasmoides fastidiosum TaxID=92758 RepID=UPI0021147515|nr:translation initiation factor IF-3 [Mycoplasmoides fastidiosum]UUD37456.1 translation initiation factor IF-3 [Mycoplasmoides fastidiosum]